MVVQAGAALGEVPWRYGTNISHRSNSIPRPFLAFQPQLTPRHPSPPRRWGNEQICGESDPRSIPHASFTLRSRCFIEAFAVTCYEELLRSSLSPSTCPAYSSKYASYNRLPVYGHDLTDCQSIDVDLSFETSPPPGCHFDHLLASISTLKTRVSI